VDAGGDPEGDAGGDPEGDVVTGTVTETRTVTKVLKNFVDGEGGWVGAASAHAE